MTLKRSGPPRKISAKRQKALGGRKQFSTIVAKPKRIKPKKRSASEFNRIYGSRARVSWVKSQPCLFCDMISPLFGDQTRGKCHNAHTENGGMGRKAEYTTIVPLCASHHARYDQHRKPFDTPGMRELMRRGAVYTERAWLASLPPLEASPK